MRLENMNAEELSKLLASFTAQYDVEEKDAIWKSQSQQFRDFWDHRIMTDAEHELGDAEDELADGEIDEIVRILDRHGKGNTAASEAIARAMIPQGAWRRMFSQIKANSLLRNALNSVFINSDSDHRAAEIDRIYKINRGRRNNLTGQSGNAINAMLAAYDPFTNLSAISLNDRRKVIESLGVAGGPDFDQDSVGRKTVLSNSAIIDGLKKLGLSHNARTISVFLYLPPVKALWKPEQEGNFPSPESAGLPPAAAGPESIDLALFYMESQLEDFLVENWDKTELGARYDLIEEGGELVSQQYRTGIGIIDILAEDKKTKQLVVIELKKNQTSDDTVGQLTRYMGWLEEHKTNGKATKGIIIAARHDIRLHYALKKVRDVEVYLYRVNFSLEEFKPR